MQNGLLTHDVCTPLENVHQCEFVKMPVPGEPSVVPRVNRERLFRFRFAVSVGNWVVGMTPKHLPDTVCDPALQPRWNSLDLLMQVEHWVPINTNRRLGERPVCMSTTSATAIPGSSTSSVSTTTMSMTSKSCLVGIDGSLGVPQSLRSHSNAWTGPG